MQRNAGLATIVTIVTIGAAALALAGCAPAAPAPGEERISIVAATDVYGAIAERLGGDLVEVTAIISGTAQDPHEYEATARDQLAVQGADLVIVNGGGYDDFMTRLLTSTDVTVITATEVAGLVPAEEAHGEADEHVDEDHAGHAHDLGVNEHVWYSVHAVEDIATAITAALIDLAPDQAGVLTELGDALLAELDALHTEIHELGEQLGGGDILSTEFVSAYLLTDLGFHDVTPAGFAAAIEEGTGVSVRTLDEVLDALGSGEIRLVATNPQSTGSEAERILEAAVTAGIPIVEFAETLPADLGYVDWMAANVEAIRAALS